MQSIVDAPWDNLVTTEHLDARLAQVDARFARVESRFDTMEVRIDATIAQSLRKQTIWMVSAMFAFNGLLAAWITAFH